MYVCVGCGGIAWVVAVMYVCTIGDECESREDSCVMTIKEKH